MGSRCADSVARVAKKLAHHRGKLGGVGWVGRWASGVRRKLPACECAPDACSARGAMKQWPEIFKLYRPPPTKVKNSGKFSTNRFRNKNS